MAQACAAAGMITAVAQDAPVRPQRRYHCWYIATQRLAVPSAAMELRSPGSGSQPPLLPSSSSSALYGRRLVRAISRLLALLCAERK